MSKALPTVTREEVAKHNSPDSAWIIIDDTVFDITKFAALHPGGTKILLSTAGTDQTKDFWGLHKREVLDKYAPRLAVAKVKDAKPVKYEAWGDLSNIPFAEPSHMRRGWRSPFYDEGLKKFRMAVRAILDRDVRAWAEQAEISGEYPPKEIFQKMGREGILAAAIGPGPHLAIPPQLPGGVSPKDFNKFHMAIVHEEFGRLNCPGAADGIIAGYYISLPVVAHFGIVDKAKAQQIVRDCVLGEKRIVLAVTEPFAGSDVASVRLTAQKSADGSHYLLNGVKKWITSAMPADYFVTLARTGGAGANGLSYFLVERSEGLETKQIATAYSKSAGTSLVIYEDVKVPASHLVGGKEGQGFVQAMLNFSNERAMIVARMLAVERCVLADCWAWAAQREVFGKPLIQQPVIRVKLADLTARLEAVQAWYELVLYQMNTMSFEEQGQLLSSTISLLKYECTRFGALLQDQAPQILGGRAITQTGMGKNIERYTRTAKYASILGGSEEVLADQAVRMAMREFRMGSKM